MCRSWQIARASPHKHSQSVKSLNSGLELSKPNGSIEAQVQAIGPENAAVDPKVMAHFTELLGRSHPLTVGARDAASRCLVDLEASGAAEDLQAMHELRDEQQRITTQGLQAAAAELGLD